MNEPGERYAGWPRAAASAAIFRGREVLLVERGKGNLEGWWSLPGGHIEPGERARDAARREVHEETGIVAVITGLVDVHDVIFHAADGALRTHYVLSVYVGRWESGEPLAASDARTAQFVPFDGLAAVKLTEGARDLILKAAAQAGLA